jgi:hypothetical protein
MKNPFVEQENKTDWYINYNLIEKYLQIDKIDNQKISKFVHMNLEENLLSRKIKRIQKQRIGAPPL